LIVSQYYQNFLDPSNFGTACQWREKEIEENVALMSTSAKENFIIALNGFVANGTLDSMRRIKAFEKALNCNFFDLE
jgi:hypothetical protein